ncbi:MAG: hypothetical protein ABGZ17_10780 [Planctomycetaceae bacterium]
MSPTIESWTENPANIGPLYPFVGWEVPMGVACAAVCVGFLVWKFRSENAHYEDMVRRLKDAADSAQTETGNADIDGSDGE